MNYGTIGTSYTHVNKISELLNEFSLAKTTFKPNMEILKLFEAFRVVKWSY